MNVEVANRLQQLRKAKGLSQEELANILGLSRQAVSKWERAETSPDTDNLICLAKLYNISIDKLLDTGESLDEIKERIAQERIDEINNAKEEIEELESIGEEKKNDDLVESLSEEEKKIKKKTDEKLGNIYITLLGIGIAGYIIIGNYTHDWSWGWLLIVQALFGASVVTGLYEEKQFSVVSCFMFIGATLFSFRHALDITDSNGVVLSILAISSIALCGIISIIAFIAFLSKNSENVNIINYKNRYIEQRDKYQVIKQKLDDLQKEIDKVNK